MNLIFNPSRIQQRIKRQGLKIKAVAGWLGTSPSNLSRKLKGERNFMANELGPLANILRVDVNEFYEKQPHQAD